MRYLEFLGLALCVSSLLACSAHKIVDSDDASPRDAEASESFDGSDELHEADVEEDIEVDVEGDVEVDVEALCGNASIETGEDCEEGDLNGASCAGEGFAGGMLRCVDCAFDTSECHMDCDASQIVRSGDFTSVEAWSTIGSAHVDVSAEGGASPGLGVFPLFPASEHCNADGLVQTVTIPSIEACGPARITRWFRTDDIYHTLGTVIGGSWLISDSGTWEDQDLWLESSTCLGEAAYGGERELMLAPLHCNCDCFRRHGERLWVDDVSISFDSTCPRIGEVLNGDFESDERLWESRIYHSEDSAHIELGVEGVGVGGTRAGRLTASGSCADPRIGTRVSVPSLESMPFPALRFRAEMTAGARADLKVEHTPNVRFGRLESFEARTICLPRMLAGSVRWIWFTLSPDRTSPYCEPLSSPETLIVDDVEIVNEPTCVSGNGFLDPGFEASGSPTTDFHGWTVTDDPCTDSDERTMEFIDNPAMARSGESGLRILLGCGGHSPQAHAVFAVPAATDVGGPALVFWSRLTPASPDVTIYVALSQSGSTLLQVENFESPGEEYQRYVFCLPPRAAGRPFWMDIGDGGRHRGPGTAELWLDDFEVTTDESCPLEWEGRRETW